MTGSSMGAVRAVLWERCGGHCELCGRALTGGFEAHHRRLRSRGGDDSAANLVAVHPGCHRWIHANPAEATKGGFMVPSWADPAETTIRYMGVATVWLRPDGTVADDRFDDLCRCGHDKADHHHGRVGQPCDHMLCDCANFEEADR